MLVPQGYCRAKELDRACFEVSDYGFHLLLVVERTNCRQIDGGCTKIERGEDGASKTFVVGGVGQGLDNEKIAQ